MLFMLTSVPFILCLSLHCPCVVQSLLGCDRFQSLHELVLVVPVVCLNDDQVSEAETWDVAPLVGDPVGNQTHVGTTWKNGHIMHIGPIGKILCIHDCGQPLTSASAMNYFSPDAQRALLGNSCCTCCWMATNHPATYDKLGWNRRKEGHEHGGACFKLLLKEGAQHLERYDVGDPHHEDSHGCKRLRLAYAVEEALALWSQVFVPDRRLLGVGL